MDFNHKREIGSTGLMAGRLGLGAGYGAPAAAFEEAFEKGVFDLFQIRYNAAHRGAEKDAFPYLKARHQPGIISYTATRWGHLLNPKKMPPGEVPPPAADCYRFALTHPAVDVALCGPKTVEHMKAALQVLDMRPMDDAELSRMKKIGDHVHATSSKFF